MSDPHGVRDPGEIQLTGQLRCASARQIETVRRFLPEHIRLTRAERGCLLFEVLPASEPGVWHVRERFEDADAFRAHQARVAQSEWGRATADIERAYEITGVPAGP